MRTGRAQRVKTTGRKGSVPPDLPVITLLTDFGTHDYFAGAVKGAILSVNRRAVIADITHEIPPQDVEAGAFMLLASYQTFPSGTIHIAVVDPGVGSARRPIVARAADQFFVGPDNGIFTYIYERETTHEVFHVTADQYFRPSPSSTFHGRDIFAPVAAALSKGVTPEDLGSLIVDQVRLQTSLEPERLKNGEIRGRILHIDRFGNCITNLTRAHLAGRKRPSLIIKRKTISSFEDCYSSANPNALFAIWGSAGFLEISMNGSSAAANLRVRRGDAVIVK